MKTITGTAAAPSKPSAGPVVDSKMQENTAVKTALEKTSGHRSGPQDMTPAGSQDKPPISGVNNLKLKENHEEKFIPYPEVKEPTPSAKKRKAQELAEDKKTKIASGFYQQNSDEDDTLEHIASLPGEESEKTRLKSLNLKKFINKLSVDNNEKKAK
ncbi:hypothetical protein GCK32_009442 [Trichostrongylus colubriformis]|uniref:Uncharacterized protein n=1 Tax=Trichostrongylus colubriformis TaxID=6319 RepID=A0AAN8J1W5_TRICO